MLRTSYYVRGSGISYLDYLQGQQYVDDLKQHGNVIAFDIMKTNREQVASIKSLQDKLISIQEVQWDRTHELREELREKNREIQEQQAQNSLVAEQVGQGFERLSYSLDNISDSFRSGMKALGGKFDWAFNNLLTGMERMQDSLQELKNLVKNPMLTASLEHFEAARSDFRRKLYREALEELDAAINGVPGVSAGYKTEWRFHQLVGTIRLGFAGCDPSLVDLAAAEKSYLLAARYAELDYPAEAATAYLSAGWAAYCQGNLDEAVMHFNKAVEKDPDLGEAWYLLGKTFGAKNDSAAYNYLRKAAFIDRIYVLKALSDNDYNANEKSLLQCVELVNTDYYKLYDEFTKQFIENNAEFKNIPSLKKEVERICRSNVFTSRESFDKDFWQFRENLEKYVNNRRQCGELLGIVQRRIETIEKVTSHPDFSLWRVKKLLADFKDRHIALKAEFDKNDYTKKRKITFGDRVKELRDDIGSYQVKLGNAVGLYYKRQLKPIDKQIVYLISQIENEKVILNDDTEIVTSEIKGGLQC